MEFSRTAGSLPSQPPAGLGISNSAKNLISERRIDLRTGGIGGATERLIKRWRQWSRARIADAGLGADGLGHDFGKAIAMGRIRAETGFASVA